MLIEGGRGGGREEDSSSVSTRLLPPTHTPEAHTDLAVANTSYVQIDDCLPYHRLGLVCGDVSEYLVLALHQQLHLLQDTIRAYTRRLC